MAPPPLLAAVTAVDSRGERCASGSVASVSKSDAPPRHALSLTPVHLVRAGEGLDAVRVTARGPGFILGTFGLMLVGRGLDAIVLRRFRTERCRALLLGFAGVAWVSIALPPRLHVDVPKATPAEPPRPPAVEPVPELAVRLTVTPPVPP